MVDQSLNKEFSNKIGPLIKGTRAIASNLMYLSNGLTIIQPMVQKSKSYAIIKPEYQSDLFNRHYFNVPRTSLMLSKFKKTKSECSWINFDEQSFFRILNPDSNEPLDTYVMKSDQEVEYFLDDEFKKVPGWNELGVSMLIDEPDSEFMPTDPNIPEDLRDRKLCELDADGYRILVSRPFMGDFKNTEYLGFRILKIEDHPHGRIFIKFKQKEPIGNIYSFAAFMKVKKEEE